ncbi:MAG: LPS assembly protein LptD [Candidatus Korobacteraceae bacterium]|jgi:LPS-assembly protein
MMSRIRLIITALLLCHLFLRPGVLTSQLPASGQQQNPAQTPAQPPASKPEITVRTDAGEEDTKTEQIIQQELQENSQQELGPPRPAINVAPDRNEILIRADEQEKNQDIYRGRGHVEIRFGTSTLHADQATYDSTTGQVTATGHVVFDGGPHNEHVVGSHATYDVSRDSGIFYDATGSTGARVKNKAMFLTSSTPFFFTGKVVERLGPDHYRVYYGFVTSCQLPKPKWQLDSKMSNIEIGDEAQLHHATLKLDGIPVFYFPYVQHPADNLGRQSGFLVPAIGQSNSRGTILGDGFYWVISRNSDATIGADLYSKRGWAEYGNLRWLGLGSAFEAQYFGVIDYKGNPQTGQNQGGEEFKANGFKQLPYGFVGVLNVDYLSSYIFRLAFAQGFTEAINSEVRSDGFLIKSWNGYGLSLLASRYQNYESENPGDFISIVHAPSLELSMAERPFDRSDFVYAYDAAIEGVSRSEIGFATAPIVGRVDAAPYLAWPKLFRGWTLRPEVGARETYYTERLEPSSNSTLIGRAIQDPINRNVANASFEVRPPTLSKIFKRKPFRRVLKHTIEPFAIYRYQTGISDFSQIIRFDYRDILADTNEVEYGVINRLYSKKTTLSAKCYQQQESSSLSGNPSTTDNGSQKAACKDRLGPAGNVVTWELAQKYFLDPTFGGALVPGVRNVFDSTVDFTGIAFLTEPRIFSPIISRLRFQSGNTDFQWALDYDPVLHQVNASTIFAGYRWGNWYLNGGQTYLDAPGEVALVNGVEAQQAYNQWRIGTIYGGMTKPGFSAAVSVGMSANPPPLLQGATIQTNYNWDCCGLAFQYQRYALGTVRNENAYHFSFSLTNVGTFGSIKRLQRLY